MFTSKSIKVIALSALCAMPVTQLYAQGNSKQNSAVAAAAYLTLGGLLGGVIGQVYTLLVHGYTSGPSDAAKIGFGLGAVLGACKASFQRIAQKQADKVRGKGNDEATKRRAMFAAKHNEHLKNRNNSKRKCEAENDAVTQGTLVQIAADNKTAEEALRQKRADARAKGDSIYTIGSHPSYAYGTKFGVNKDVKAAERITKLRLLYRLRACYEQSQRAVAR